MFYGWWLVLFSAISLAVMGPAYVAVANLFQNPVTHEFGITNSQFAISNSLVLGMGIFLSPFISKKLAFGNFRLVYIVGVMIYGLAYIGFGFSPNMYVFYALALLVGVGNVTTTIIPVSMLVNNWFVKKRGLALSLSFTVLGVGGVIFSQAVTCLITNVGWRYTYLIYGLIILLVGIPIGWFVFRARPEDMGMTAYGAEEPVSLKEGEKEVAATTPPASGVVVTKPYFILLLIGGVMVVWPITAAWDSSLPCWQIYMDRFVQPHLFRSTLLWVSSGRLPWETSRTVSGLYSVRFMQPCC